MKETGVTEMWADESNPNWLKAWSGRSHCPSCHTLMKSSQPCPNCNFRFTPHEASWVDETGMAHREERLVTPGAFSVTTATLLRLMQREWERPIPEAEGKQSFIEEVSPRFVVVLVFWTLFEHLMDRLFNSAVSRMPAGVGRDLLERYSSIGARMDRLYKILFEKTLKQDLTLLGHSSVYEHLLKIQARRNDLVHGNATAIDDSLVYETVERLHEVQEAIIAVFNLRCVGDPDAAPMWRETERKVRKV